MMKTSFLVGALVAGWTGSSVAADLAVSFRSSGWAASAAVERISDGTGRVYTADAVTPVFSVVVVSVADFADAKTVTAFDAAKRTAEPLADGQRLVFADFKERLEKVVCTVRSTDNGRLRWRIAVTPKPGFAATLVDYPKIMLKPRLGADGADDAIVHGGRNWGLVHDPGATWDPKKWDGLYLQQPENLFAQFACYYDPEGGLYTAAEDAETMAKGLQFQRQKDGILLTWQWKDWIVSARELPYDIVTAAVRGRDGEPLRWQDAADVYRAWARGQRWCKTPFRDRADLPEWLRSAVPIVRFDREWLDKPEHVRQWLEKYWKARYPHMPLVGAVWGWEKHGYWITPDYFPMYPDDATFAQIVAAFRANGVRFFPWPSGYNWTLTYKPRPDGTFEYESRAAFEKVRHLACATAAGDVLLKKPSWYFGGEMPVLCRGDARTRDWWTTSVAGPLMDRGAELVQFDQVNGGRHPPCWSRGHGHPPHAGRWWAGSMLAQLDQVQAAARKRGTNLVLGFEDPNEFYLDRVGVQDYRDTEITSTNRTVASVWNYLYHEFVPTFPSNPKRGNRWQQAHCAADGQMPFLDPDLSDIGGAAALPNGDFSQVEPKTGRPVGWTLGHSAERGGTATVVRGGAPNGLNAVRLTAKAGETAYLFIDSRTAGDGAYVPGERYRFSFLVKVDAGRNGRFLDGIFTAGWKNLGGVGGNLPAAGSGWQRIARDYTMPKGATIAHFGLVVPGDGDASFADVKVERVRADGTAERLVLKGDDAYTRFMARWVSLYHGEGRDFLAYGRQIRPPRVDCAKILQSFRKETTRFTGEVEAVCSAAYETLDGTRRALVLVNATAERQPVRWTWRGREAKLELQPDEIRIVPL